MFGSVGGGSVEGGSVAGGAVLGGVVGAGLVVGGAGRLVVGVVGRRVVGVVGGGASTVAPAGGTSVDVVVTVVTVVTVETVVVLVALRWMVVVGRGAVVEGAGGVLTRSSEAPLLAMAQPAPTIAKPTTAASTAATSRFLGYPVVCGETCGARPLRAGVRAAAACCSTFDAAIGAAPATAVADSAPGVATGASTPDAGSTWEASTPTSGEAGESAPGSRGGVRSPLACSVWRSSRRSASTASTLGPRMAPLSPMVRSEQVIPLARWNHGAMVEPEVGELDERLAHDFARLGFRAADHNRRASPTELDDGDAADEPDGDAEGSMDLGNGPGLAESLAVVVQRLDWIDATLAALPRALPGSAEVSEPEEVAPSSGLEAILDRLAALDARLDDRMARIEATFEHLAGAAPWSDESSDRQMTTIEQLVTRIDALGTLIGRLVDQRIDDAPVRAATAAIEALSARVAELGEQLGEAATTKDTAELQLAVRRLGGRVAAVGEAVAASAKQAKVQQGRLDELAQALDALQRGLGV